MKKYLHATGIAIALVIVILLVKNQYTPFLLRNANYGMPALVKKGSVENLYLGSSMFRQGLEIGILEEDCAESYVLAYNGNQPVTELFELEFLLEQGVKIENLYVDLYVYSAAEPPEISDEKLFLELGIAKKVELLRRMREGGASLDASSLWRMWVSANNESLLTWPVQQWAVNALFWDGGTLIQNSGKTEAELDGAAPPTLPEELNATQMQAIREMIAVAKENGIKITFLETPKYETVAENEYYLNQMQVFVTLLEEEGAACILSETTAQSIDSGPYADVYVFDSTDAGNYIDLLHLSSDGRRNFTEAIRGCLNP